MNENSYFSDITDLFLKAKKAENIEIDPHAKAATREMLSYKIEQLKRGKPQAVSENFWSKWKKTIIGVPASILAVFVIVFALQNNQIETPQEDIFSEAEIMQTVEDSAVIEDIEQAKERTMKIEPLVIDYGDKPQKTEPQESVAQQTVIQTKTAVSTGGGQTKPVESVQPVVSDAPTVTSSEEVAPTVAPTPAPTPQPQPTPVPEPEPIQQISEPIKITEPVQTIMPIEEEVSPKKVQEIIKDEIVIETDENITHYREPISPVSPDFDKTALEKLEITDNLSSVNVHYLNEDQAAVEVTTDGETRWYMFEEINGNWTVTQKFD